MPNLFLKTEYPNGEVAGCILYPDVVDFAEAFDGSVPFSDIEISKTVEEDKKSGIITDELFYLEHGDSIAKLIIDNRERMKLVCSVKFSFKGALNSKNMKLITKFGGYIDIIIKTLTDDCINQLNHMKYSGDLRIIPFNDDCDASYTSSIPGVYNVSLKFHVVPDYFLPRLDKKLTIKDVGNQIAPTFDSTLLDD